MAVTKRGNSWQATYRGPDRKERTKTFRTRPEAERWHKAQSTDVARGEWIDPRGGKRRFDEWAAEWFATTVNLRPSTRARDESYLRSHILRHEIFKDRRLIDITQPDVQRWASALGARLAPATVAKSYQILGKIMRAAVDGGLLAKNPCSNVKLRRVEREEMRFLTAAQVSGLADAIHPRYRALVLVAAYGGLRMGELSGLKRTRVDILRSRVEIAEVCVEVKGELTWGPPKTRAGRRSMTLPKSVSRELSDHLIQWPNETWVFTSPGPKGSLHKGGPLRVNAWRRRVWVPTCLSVGLGEMVKDEATGKRKYVGLRPHDLRHTAVAMWIASGANPLEVSRRAGHTSVSFTLDRYGHLYDGADAALSERLEEMFVAAPPPTPAALQVVESARG